MDSVKAHPIGITCGQADIRKAVGLLRFGAESAVSLQEPLERYLFFMNADKTMTTIRFEGGKIQYQGKEFMMNRETRDYLDKYFR